MARTSTPFVHDVSVEASSLLRQWAGIWDAPQLANGVRVQIEPRLRRALARCHLDQRIIRLSPRLLGSDGRPWLAEALCHEAAHLVVHWKVSRRARPHGPEWRDLVVLAGFEPHVRLEWGRQSARRLGEGKPVLYLHRCPVCHASRMARRPMPAWRCPGCVAAGLGGQVVIESRPAPRGRTA